MAQFLEGGRGELEIGKGVEALVSYVGHLS